MKFLHCNPTEAQIQAHYAAEEMAREAFLINAAQQAAGNCTRCNGRGRIRGFSHVEGGQCFACKGTGKARIRAAA